MADDRERRDRFEALQVELRDTRTRLADERRLSAEVEAALPSLATEVAKLRRRMGELTARVETERLLTLEYKRRFAEADLAGSIVTTLRSLALIAMLTLAIALAFALEPHGDVRVAVAAGLVGCGLMYRIGRSLRPARARPRAASEGGTPLPRFSGERAPAKR